MMRAAPLLAVLVALCFVPAGDAAPTASWTGATSSFACVNGICQIVTSPVDDEDVSIGTGDFRQVRLTLTPQKGEELGLRVTIGKTNHVFESGSSLSTGWMDVSKVDKIRAVAFQDEIPMTGFTSGVAFTLTASYR